MAQDVWDYFHQWETQCGELSLAPDDGFAEMFHELAGSNGTRGRIFGRLILDDRAFLSVSELVTVQAGYAHREEYAYFLVRDGDELWGREREPSHDPPEHGHGPAHEWQEAGPISFRGAAEAAWRINSQEQELEG